MNRLVKLGAGLAVVAVALGVGAVVFAMAGNDGGDAPVAGDRTGVEDGGGAGACPQENPNCVDTDFDNDGEISDEPVAGGGAASGACPIENPDCVDTDFNNDGQVSDEPVAGGAAGMCAPDHPDCVDMIVNTDGASDPDCVVSSDGSIACPDDEMRSGAGESVSPGAAR